MPVYKMTWVFNWGKTGWSESWYIESTDITTALLRATGALCGARKGLLGKGALIEAAIVSDVNEDGDSLAADIPVGGDFKPVDTPADTAWNAMYCRVDAAARARRQLWLRGLPDEWILPDPVTKKNTPNAALLAAFNKFRDEALGAGGRVKLKTYDRAGIGTTGLPVTALAADTTGWTKVSCASFTGAVGQKVGMRKWKGTDRKILNKTFSVVKVDPTFIVIDLLFTDLQEPTADYNGRVYPKIPTFSDVTKMAITRLARRKTGRAFFVSPGRQRVAR